MVCGIVVAKLRPVCLFYAWCMHIYIYIDLVRFDICEALGESPVWADSYIISTRASLVVPTEFQASGSHYIDFRGVNSGLNPVCSGQHLTLIYGLLIYIIVRLHISILKVYMGIQI